MKPAIKAMQEWQRPRSAACGGCSEGPLAQRSGFRKGASPAAKIGQAQEEAPGKEDLSL